MQTTLLGIAIALILAVFAALVAPFVIDWTAYRTILEAESSRVIGANVAIEGAIDARLLPSPRVTLHNVSIGSGPERMHADELDLQFALTPLLRGNWQAEEMRLVGPQLTLRLDRGGRLHAPEASANFDPESLSVDRLQIEGGTLTLAAAEKGASVTLYGVFFNGRARSLVGPFDGSGAFSIGNESYSLENFSTGRINDGAIRIHAAVQPGEHPYRIEGDGTLTLADGKARFDGDAALAPPKGLQGKNTPWHLRGKVTADAGATQLQNLEFSYGAEKEPLKLTGLVRFDYAKSPLLSAHLTAARIDLDRVFGGQPHSPAPLAVLRELAASSGAAAFLSSVPISAGFKIEEVVLGGGSLLELNGALKSTRDGWQLNSLAFRAPGFSKVALSGDVKVAEAAVTFSGPADVNAGDPNVLLAWLEGRGVIAATNAPPLSLHGKLTLGTDAIALDELTAKVNGQSISGRVAYALPSGKQGAALDLALDADRLDLDSAFAFAKTVAAGSAIASPQSIKIKAAIGQASLAGISGRGLNADAAYDAKGLSIRAFSVADLGGARFEVSGEIAHANGGSQHGKLQADLSAADLTPVLAILSRVAPNVAAGLQPMQRSAAKLHADLTVQPGTPMSRAALKLNGDIGEMQMVLNADGRADLLNGALGDVRIETRVTAAQARMLLPLMRLDQVVEVNDGPGTLNVKANGHAFGAMNVNANVNAAGFNASLSGKVDLSSERRADLHIAVAQANAAPLLGVSGTGALPVKSSGTLALRGDKLTLGNIKAEIGASKLNGKLNLTLGEPTRIAGALEVDSTLSVPELVAAMLGTRLASRNAKGWSWSSDPFLPDMFTKFEGDVAMVANRAVLAPSLEARRLRGTLHFGPHEIVARDMSAELAGGRLTSELTLRNDNSGVQIDGHVALTGAEASALIGSAARPPLTGALNVDVLFEGGGLSPVALVGSLHGSGKLALTNVQFAGLDPRAFDAVTRAVDQGVPIEPARISTVVAQSLTSGSLQLKQAEGALAIDNGQVRLERMKAASQDAEVSVSGALDLTDGVMDGHVVLSGNASAAGVRPDIYMAVAGPLADAQRSVDVSALTGWLTLRAVENQAKKVKALEEAEAKRRADEEAQAKLRAEQRRAEQEARARAEQAEPAPGLLPLLQSAPALPPPINIERAPVVGVPISR